MADETTKPADVTPAPISDVAAKDQSMLFGVSVRAWLTVMLVVTVCYMSVATIQVAEPLYTLVVAAISFYFGRQK